MKVVVVYDSKYGNTAKIANALVSAIEEPNITQLLLAQDATNADLHRVGMLIVGSPTQGGRPTQNIQKFLENLPNGALKNISVVAFDTRFAVDEHGVGLELLMKTMGFAASHIAAGLEAKGGVQLVEPEGFIVQQKEGPLRKSELDRANKWAKSLLSIR